MKTFLRNLKTSRHILKIYFSVVFLYYNITQFTHNSLHLIQSHTIIETLFLVQKCCISSVKSNFNIQKNQPYCDHNRIIIKLT